MATEPGRQRSARRKKALPAGIALPPRHQTFGGGELMSRFVSAANGDAFVDIAEDSATLCTWRCSGGHEYQETRAAHRHSRGCPICATSVATRMPGLLKYWDDQKNGVSPADVSAYDRERYHWICDHGHSFERPPYRVLATGHQCKACRQAGLTPWLIAGKRDDSSTLAEEFPAIAAEWDGALNSRGPEEFAPGSQRVVYWRCENGHSWSSPICHRTSAARRPASCQQCKAIAFSAPDLAAQLHPTLNPPGIAQEVRKGSSQVLFWQCDRGHVFSASVAARLRTSYPAACDQCRSIAVKAPDLIDACWAYELNGQLDPEVLKTSSTQEVWWVRVDSLNVQPTRRRAEHFERKRIGYRYRCYLSDRDHEVAKIAAHLKSRDRSARSKQTVPRKVKRGA